MVKYGKLGGKKWEKISVFTKHFMSFVRQSYGIIRIESSFFELEFTIQVQKKEAFIIEYHFVPQQKRTLKWTLLTDILRFQNGKA